MFDWVGCNVVRGQLHRPPHHIEAKRRLSMEMLQDVIHPPDNHTNREDDFTDAISAEQILDFCDDGDLFTETLRTSEPSSCSGCYGSGNGNNNDKGSGENFCCFDEGSFSSSDPFASMDASTLSALLDDQTLDNSTMTTIDYSSPPLQPASSFNSQTYLQENPQAQIMVTDNIINGYTPVRMSAPPPVAFVSPQPPQLPLPQLPGFEEEPIVSTLSGYLGLDAPVPPRPSCSLMNQAGTGIGMFFPGMPLAGEEMYPESMMVGAVQVPEIIEYQAESGGGLGGLYGMGTNQTQMVYGSGEIQAVGDGQHLVATGCSSPTPLVADIPSLDDSTFKVGRISPEEKQQKILRYLKKRHERNFSKKIKYACRKTLADSRPRVRGRFAKNDELVVERRINSGKHDDEDDEVMIKEEGFIMESNDIMAELNSFKCNYALDHWV